MNINFHHFAGLSIALILIGLSSCNKVRSDPTKITMRPRVFIENSAPVPILDEYDFVGVQLGTIANVISSNPDDRVYTLWFSLDRRSAIAIQKETVRNVGKNLQLIIAGQLVGIHPIEKGILNGMLPFILSSNVSDENAILLYEELSRSIVHLRAEMEEHKL